MDKPHLQFGSFLMRSSGRTFMGFGVVEEWRAYTMDQARVMLEDMRHYPGWKVGYFSYDFGAKWQGVDSLKKDEFKTPLLHFVVPEEVYIYDDVEFELEWMKDGFEFSASKPNSIMKKSDYKKAIQMIHGFLKEGETYEVNFAHRFNGTFEGMPLEVFRRLHEINPSPYACYLNFDPITVVSNSPEQLVRGIKVADRMVLSTRPIKGTVPRGRTKLEDKKLIAELLASEKNEAELNMIVDLARNDLGKVSEVGSVKMRDHRAIESYSHLHHTVSEVRSVLEKDLDWVDVLKALFPGGSITGAPKKRTMEIIDRLEPVARGIYTGSAGWVSPEGEFDFSILIRTIAFQRAQGLYSFHSGGGIVMDSNPEEEYEETLHKIAALVESLS